MWGKGGIRLGSQSRAKSSACPWMLDPNLNVSLAGEAVLGPVPPIPLQGSAVATGPLPAMGTLQLLVR